MEHEMKISPAVVRRSRIERGWSQEQLAIASGLSLRTVQRVEAEGIASLSTAASLAATYGIPLIQLQGEPPSPRVRQAPGIHSTLFLGLALLMLGVMGESVRLAMFPTSLGDPRSTGFAAISILAAVAGALLLVPAAVRIRRARQYVGAALAVVGTPLATLLLARLIVSALSGRPPDWPLIAIGAGGIALIAMAFREFRRGDTTAGA
jgi:transcriptional regulator with XRE-family HTH domain